MIGPLFAIGAGASLGAILGWVLGTQLNALFPSLPPGTLVLVRNARFAGG